MSGLPYSDAAYVEMWDRVVTEWRSRNDFRHLLDFGRSRSTILTATDLQRLLDYLSGFPEAQRDAIDGFKARQVERDAEAARRARRQGKGKQAARDFIAERRAFLKTLSKKGRSR